MKILIITFLLLKLKMRNKMNNNFVQSLGLLNESEMELRRTEFFKKINMRGEKKRTLINKATEAHKYMEWFFDSVVITFENGDYIDVENCPVWNESHDNFLSVALYYLTPE